MLTGVGGARSIRRVPGFQALHQLGQHKVSLRQGQLCHCTGSQQTIFGFGRAYKNVAHVRLPGNKAFAELPAFFVTGGNGDELPEHFGKRRIVHRLFFHKVSNLVECYRFTAGRRFRQTTLRESLSSAVPLARAILARPKPPTQSGRHRTLEEIAV